MSYSQLGQFSLASRQMGQPASFASRPATLSMSNPSSSSSLVSREAPRQHMAVSAGQRFRGLGTAPAHDLSQFSSNVRYVLDNALSLQPSTPGRFVGQALSGSLAKMPTEDRLKVRDLVANEAVRAISDNNIMSLGRKLTLLDATRMSGSLPLSYYVRLAAVDLVRAAPARTPMPTNLSAPMYLKPTSSAAPGPSLVFQAPLPKPAAPPPSAPPEPSYPPPPAPVTDAAWAVPTPGMHPADVGYQSPEIFQQPAAPLVPEMPRSANDNRSIPWLWIGLGVVAVGAAGYMVMR